MGKVSIACLVVSTIVVLITFGQGIGLLRGGDVASHLHWAMTTLVCVLAANMVAIIHAAQSDRLIRDLRREREPDAMPAPGDGLDDGPQL
jgi:hypothetical protein